MNRIWKMLGAVLLATFLGGCAQAPEKTVQTPLSRVVIRVEVDGRHEGAVIRRRYESQEKMGAILNYLRPLRSLGPADKDPERIAGDAYEIRLWRYDGGCEIYRLRSDRYLSKNSHAWQLVEQRQAQRLYPLLLELESDSEGAVFAALSAWIVFAFLPGVCYTDLRLHKGGTYLC